MALTLVLTPVASRHLRGGCEKQGACTSRVVASTGEVEMSQKRDLRSLFLSSLKFCQPLVALQAASMSSVRAVYAEGGRGGSGAVLEDGGAGLKSFVWSDPKRPRICVLGGGFVGLYTALRLESLIWPPDKKPQIVLVDQSDRFVFKPLLYELLSKEVESWEVAPSFKDLLANSSIQFCQDTVRSIQPFDAVNGTPALATTSRDVGGSVYLSSGMQVDYDWLVLALGSEPRMNIVPGASGLAIPFNSLEDALEVERRLVALEKDASEFAPIEIVVVGSGYCGIELAATLAERLGKNGPIKVVDMASDIVGGPEPQTEHGDCSERFPPHRGDRNEFQLPGLENGSADTNDAILEEAVAEAAKVLHAKGNTLGQKLAYNEDEVEIQDAMMETVKALRGRQSSFVRNAPSNAQKRRQFWDKFHSSGFAKALKKDGMAMKSWLQAVKPQNKSPKAGATNILANDIDFVKKNSTLVGPSLSKKVGEIVALRIIEDETAVPAAPAFWPKPYYPELRGRNLLAADLKALESYSSYIQGVFQSFQVPLQNDYDPDQVAAYFHRRPHILVFRFLEVGVAFSSVALERSLRMATLKKNKLGEISEEDDLQVTLKTAASLKQALLGLGTTFIKVAQSLSARPDLIGTETAKVLSELQDRLPPFPKEEAVAIIEEELGCRVTEAFSFLSEEPIAAASFGQVYRGCTKSGEEVAVKVQRPDLLFQVARDVYILRIGMTILKKVAKLSNNYALIADEIGQGLYGELDYRQEAANAAEFALAHKHVPWLYVPKTLSHMTGRKLLVMEWLNGDRPFDLQSAAKGLPSEDGTLPSQEVQQEASRRLLNMVNKGTEAALIQLLETGVMHADPHPGNILLGRDGQLQFIDFGLICHMDKKHQGAMLAAIAHLVNGDWQSLTEDLADMDVVKPSTDRFAVRLALERAFGEGPDAIIKNGVPDPNFSFNKIVKKFFKIAYKFRFRLPPYYTLVLRSLASLEGFGIAVNPDFKTFGSAYPYAVRRLLLDYSPTTQRVLRSLLLTEKRAVKWDRISTLLEISQKSSSDRAALEMVTVPTEEDSRAEIASSDALAGSNDQAQPSISNIAGLLFSRQGVGIRRVIYEADARDLARMLISARAAKYRRIVAERLGEALFNTLKRKYSRQGETATTSMPTDRFAKDRRLHLILKSMVGRLQSQPILLAQAGWAFVSIAVWALALAFHNFAIHLSEEFLAKSQPAAGGVSRRAPTVAVDHD